MLEVVFLSIWVAKLSTLTPVTEQKCEYSGLFWSLLFRLLLLMLMVLLGTDLFD